MRIGNSARRHAAACRACLLQDPPADLGDQPGVLEQGDEVVGLHDPALGVLPADEGLHSGGAHVAEVERWLIGEHELVFLKGFA